MNDDRSPLEPLVTVPEAAEILGISPEAVRARLNRGTLQREKGDDGTTYVRLNADRARSNDGDTADRTIEDSPTFRIMADQISFLRAELVTRNEELRRKDHIIAALTERIPELEPASEPRESPVTASDGPGSTGPEEEKRRSWWQRLFGS